MFFMYLFMHLSFIYILLKHVFIYLFFCLLFLFIYMCMYLFISSFGLTDLEHFVSSHPENTNVELNISVAAKIVKYNNIITLSI